jgi:hypothetical protein
MGISSLATTINTLESIRLMMAYWCHNGVLEYSCHSNSNDKFSKFRKLILLLLLLFCYDWDNFCQFPNCKYIYRDYLSCRQWTVTVLKVKMILWYYLCNRCLSSSGVSRVWQVGHVPWVPLEGAPLRGFSA